MCGVSLIYIYSLNFVSVHHRTHHTTFRQLVFLFAVQLCINTGCFWYIFNTLHLKSQTSFVTRVRRCFLLWKMLPLFRCSFTWETQEEEQTAIKLVQREELMRMVQSKSALIDRFVVIMGNMFEKSFHNWRTFRLQTSTERGFWKYFINSPPAHIWWRFVETLCVFVLRGSGSSKAEGLKLSDWNKS